MLIAVIGCGPAGLLAAHAIERMGHDPIVLAPKQKSEVSKVQCLWEPIPGLDMQLIRLELVKRGNGATYTKRLYGHPQADSSWDRVQPGLYGVYALDLAYDQLWERFESRIADITIDAEVLHQIMTNYPLVFSSAPSTEFCQDRLAHRFDRVNTQILRMVSPSPRQFPKGFTVLNGSSAMSDGDNWYRYTQCRGEEVWEYADGVARTGSGVSAGIKPTGTNCDCWQSYHVYGEERPRQLRRIGRFGKWEQGVMNHHAFTDTVGILSTEGLGRST